MEISRLLIALERLRQLFEVAGAKSAQADLASIVEALGPEKHQQISEFLKKISSVPTQKRRPARPPVPPVPKLTAATLAEVHLKNLNEAGLNQNLFNQAFEALSAEKKIKKPEADQIARAFVEQQTPFKTKKAALAAIQEKFVERVRFQNQLDAVKPHDRYR